MVCLHVHIVRSVFGRMGGVVPEATKSELDFLEELPKIRTLLDECDRAAHAAKNAVILPLLAKAKEFADALEFAVRFRIKDAPNHGSVTAGARPTKSHPGIHRFNYYLLRDLPSDHPAVQALNTHVAARQMCVSKQSNRPDSGIAPIDQVWLSKVDSQEHRFSTLVKDNIDFDLYLDGWVESVPEATEIERLFSGVPRRCAHYSMNVNRWRCAANNNALLPLVSKAKEFFRSLEFAIWFRFKMFGISA